MSIALPGPLVWVIDLLGYNWPEADEDKLFSSAQAWRAFAAELRNITIDAGKVATDVGYNNVGTEIDAFAAAWKVDDEHRRLGAEAADLTASLLDAAGIATQATKIAIITILVVTAAEIIAAQAAAPETLGLSEAGAVAAEEAGRYAVRRALNKLREHAERDLAGALRREIEDRLRRINPPGNRLGIMESRGRGGGGGGHKYRPAPKNITGIPGLSLRRSKTPLQGGGGLRKRWADDDGNIYEWDSQHGALEKYDKRGKHLGEFDPDTGQQTKPADPTRSIKKYL